MIVYKITNTENSKIYIGATRLDIKDRGSKHLHDCNMGSQLAIHKAMRKYGGKNFQIEAIDDSAKTIEELKDLETQYIIKYDTLNKEKGYNDVVDNYGSSQVKRGNTTDADVMYIRSLYAKKTFGPKYGYDRYFKEKMSYSGFEKIGEGQTGNHIMPEVYTEEALKYYRTHKEGTKGEFNHNALFSSEFVLTARKYYIDHDSNETGEKFAKDKCTFDTFCNILKGCSYKNVPIYKKRKKCGMLGDEKINNIDDYKPVSTISESGE